MASPERNLPSPHKDVAPRPIPHLDIPSDRSGMMSIARIVPDIDGMLSGKPWPLNASPHTRRPQQIQRLESFHNVVHKATEGHSALPSPNVTPSTSFSSWDAPRPSMQDYVQFGYAHSLGSRTPQPEQQRLAVPEVASISSGGWFNTSNWVFRIIERRIAHMNLDELYHAFFHREDRPVYGENHSSTRTKRTKGGNNFSGDEGESFSNNGSKRHSEQERLRRLRHRVLQCQKDGTISTFVYNMAEDTLAEVKKYVEEMSLPEETDTISMAYDRRHQKPPAAARKKTGKDDQLWAACLYSWFAAYILLREHQARVEAEQKVIRLQEEIITERRARIEAEERGTRLEAEIKYLEQRMNGSRRGSSASFVHPQLLPPPTVGRKRTAADAGHNIEHSAADRLESAQHSKRQRLAVAHPHRHGGRLPPSPSPSCEDCASSFCSC